MLLAIISPCSLLMNLYLRMQHLFLSCSSLVKLCRPLALHLGFPNSKYWIKICYWNLDIFMLCFKTQNHQNYWHFNLKFEFLMMIFHLCSKSFVFVKWLYLVKRHHFQHELFMSFENLIVHLSFIEFVIRLSLFSIFFLFFC